MGAVSVPTAVGTLVLPGTLVYICVPREGTVRGVSCPCCSGEGHFVACAGDRGAGKKTSTIELYSYITITVCLVRKRKIKKILSGGNNQETFLPRQVRPSDARRRPRGHVQTKEPSVLRQPWEQPGPAEHSSVSAWKQSFSAINKYLCQTCRGSIDMYCSVWRLIHMWE